MKSRHHVKASRWPEAVLGGEPGNGIDIEVKPEPLPQQHGRRCYLPGFNNASAPPPRAGP
jgi:hypothetical protein